MSWDWTICRYECPCGKGTFTIESGSNDWGQTEERQRMDCEECRNLYTWVDDPQPERGTRSGWKHNSDGAIWYPFYSAKLLSTVYR